MSDFEWECGHCGMRGGDQMEAMNHDCLPVPWLCSYCGVGGSYKKGDTIHRCPPVARDAMGDPIVIERQVRLPGYAENIEVQFSVSTATAVCSHCYGGELRLGAECSCRCHK